MTSWKVFVAQLLTIIAGKSQTRKWALDKGVGLVHTDDDTSFKGEFKQELLDRQIRQTNTGG